MHKKLFIFCLLLISSLCGLFFYKFKAPNFLGVLSYKQRCAFVINDLNDVYNVYPSSPREIQKRCKKAIKEANAILETLKNRTAVDCTKEELLGKIDALYARVGVDLGPLEFIFSAHPDKKTREAACKASECLNTYCMQKVASNVELYALVKSVFNACSEQCTPEENHLFTFLLRDFKKMGVELNEEGRKRVVVLKNEIHALSIQFLNNISCYSKTIAFTQKELEGLSSDWLHYLKKQGDLYLVPISTQMSFILYVCSNPATRQKYLAEHLKIAYPENLEVLKQLVQRRDELARLTGYSSYVYYDLDGKMMSNPEDVKKFLEELLPKAIKKSLEEVTVFTCDLPEGVTLSENGKIKPSDLSYVKYFWDKKKASSSACLVPEYFSLEHTFNQLKMIFQQFFSIHIKEVLVRKSWYPDIRLLEITQDNKILGYIYLDMFAREDKRPGAALFNGMNGILDKDGINPTVVTLCFDFKKGEEGKPVLLSYYNLVNLFHEFGHALHSVLGATQYSLQSGCIQTERDFVELPSQIIENLLKEPEILKMISKHYKTGETIPDSFIKELLGQVHRERGDYLCSSLNNSFFSLYVFDGVPEDINALWNKCRKNTEKYVDFFEGDYRYCSIWHIVNYGPAYYGYLLTQSLGIDVFEQIKKEGLLNPEAGKRYVDCILGRGGSIDGNTMIRDYLGREATYDAFYKKMGF